MEFLPALLFALMLFAASLGLAGAMGSVVGNELR